jgi:hypothetical protein
MIDLERGDIEKAKGINLELLERIVKLSYEEGYEIGLERDD